MSVVLAGLIMVWMLAFAWAAAWWALQDVDRIFDELKKDSRSTFVPCWQGQMLEARQARRARQSWGCPDPAFRGSLMGGIPDDLADHFDELAPQQGS